MRTLPKGASYFRVTPTVIYRDGSTVRLALLDLQECRLLRARGQQTPSFMRVPWISLNNGLPHFELLYFRDSARVFFASCPPTRRHRVYARI